LDADLSGLWTPNTSNSPISVKSCTGYIITFASCTIVWSSKLQTEVALSTAEAEYIAMSQATQDLIPLQDLLHEFSCATKLIGWQQHDPVSSLLAHRKSILEPNILA
jgi:hypothetical protein